MIDRDAGVLELFAAPGEHPVVHLGRKVPEPVPGPPHEELRVGGQQVGGVHLERVPVALHIVETRLAHDFGAFGNPTCTH